MYIYMITAYLHYAQCTVVCVLGSEHNFALKIGVEKQSFVQTLFHSIWWYSAKFESSVSLTHPSRMDSLQQYRLSNFCFVTESFTFMAGTHSLPALDSWYNLQGRQETCSAGVWDFYDSKWIAVCVRARVCEQPCVNPSEHHITCGPL